MKGSFRAIWRVFATPTPSYKKRTRPGAMTRIVSFEVFVAQFLWTCGDRYDVVSL